ncbi:MAG: hypothetical protein M1817_003904 [Caeruleum heppii]|nr:MAG: hypothetical protein M1817_003904 [Caeruleum heppii]
MPDEYEGYNDYLAATDRWNDFVSTGSMIDSGENRLDYFIVGTLLEQVIPSLVQTHTSPGGVETGFPLSHPDLSVSNIFVDNDFNVTGIFDWAFSSTVPSSTLLIAPGLPHPRDDICPSLRTAFQAGFQEGLGTELIASETIGDICRRIWLFTRLVNLDSLQDFHLFAELYQSVYGVKDILRLFREIKLQEPIVDKARLLAAEDQAAGDIAQAELDYFSCVGLERRAVSRKLCLIRRMSQAFVADKRLWKWLAKAMNGST